VAGTLRGAMGEAAPAGEECYPRLVRLTQEALRRWT
jgi:hypothetical protein